MIIELISFYHRPSKGGRYCVGEQRRYGTCNTQVGEIGTTHNNVINMVMLCRSVQKAMVTREINNANLMERNGEH